MNTSQRVIFCLVVVIILLLVHCGINPKTAHRTVCFEQEATECEVTEDYLETRE